jgi:hypothetical protein
MEQAGEGTVRVAVSRRREPPGIFEYVTFHPFSAKASTVLCPSVLMGISCEHYLTGSVEERY